MLYGGADSTAGDCRIPGKTNVMTLNPPSEIAVVLAASPLSRKPPCPMGQVGEGASALLLMQDKLATGITFLSQLHASVGSRLFHDETGMVENRAPLYVLDFTGMSQARHRRNG